MTSFTEEYVKGNKIALALQHVAIGYNRQKTNQPYWAVKDVSFRVRQGETLGVIGRNGAGKSTLLRLMAGLIKPDKGLFINFGHTVSLLSLNLGFIQDLTGRENAILGGILLGMRKKDIEAKIPDIIEFSELGDFIDQPISTYSSGMSARLGFSIAFQADPDILLVDEVLGVGDAEFHQKSTAIMKERIKSNKTIVFVSHNENLIKELCDRVVWIEHGMTKKRGIPETVLQAYNEYHHVRRK